MLNNTNSDIGWNSPYSLSTQLSVWLIIIILSLETIVGNAMVIVAYRIERNISKQVSNRYIVSLAISDLIIGIEGFPFFTVYVLNGERWPLGWVACETWLFLDYTLCLVSILTVLLITADRYLSVCHTAKYLKWQSPSKTQLLIILSWLLPAIIFGIMIYGWRTMTGESSSMNGAECSAPFLSNPYVNMGMYVAYYWTTLVAMLILYKGIHQAAKNLEKKAKAKERRHIALILSQRLGTQVGVSLMLQSKNSNESNEDGPKNSDSSSNQAGDHRRFGFSEPETSKFRQYPKRAINKEDSINTDADQNLEVIEEEKSAYYLRRSSNESYLPGPHPTAANSRRCSEMDRVSLLSLNPDDTLKGKEYKRFSLRSRGSDSIAINQEDNIEKTDSLRKLFADDELNSVLNFKEEQAQKNRADSNNDSDTTSVILRQSRKYRKRKHKGNLKQMHHQSASGKFERISRHNQLNTPSNSNEQSLMIDRGAIRRQDRWVAYMKKRIVRALVRRSNARGDTEDNSYSDESTSDADGNGFEKDRRTSFQIPQVTVCEERYGNISQKKEGSKTMKSETFLSAAGVSRKLSTISTVITRERVISSIFSPISVFNRGRKQTKAEKRAHKAFRTITFIVGFFAILWSPYYIMATVYGFCKGECIPSVLYTLSYYMCYLNSSGNPFAYALANRQFRSAFIRMFRGNFNKVS